MSDHAGMASFQAVVVGGGPVGLAAACLLAQEGVHTAHVAPTHGADPRTVALMQPAIRLLSYIGIWPGHLAALSAPLRRQRIIDDTGSLFTGPALSFSASELGFDAFGWNIPVEALTAALQQQLQARSVQQFKAPASRSETISDGISVVLNDGTRLRARVCLAADGAQSAMRTSAGIGTAAWEYDQSALVASFSHSQPHDDTSCEFHKQDGPCTVVPLPGNHSALVWMTRPHQVERLSELPEPDFLAELQAAIHGQLGLLSGLTRRHAFRMRGLTATSFAAGRTLLAGEAAHVVPPIGAQGLNMSFRDVALAVDLVLAASDPGEESVIRAYNEKRKHEVVVRQQIIGAVNNSLLFGSLPLDGARAAALWAAHSLVPLRREIMLHGLGLSGQLPFAMRERLAAVATGTQG